MRFGVIAAVLAAVAAIPLVRTTMQPEPDPDARRAETGTETTQVEPDIGRAGPPIVFDMDFLDRRHGFALWGRCTNGRVYRCERRLLVTEDGGVNWMSRGFDNERLAAPQQLTGRIIVLGEGRLLVTDSNNRSSASRYFSNDNGLTWQAVPFMPAATIPEIPRDGLLETQCTERANGVCQQRRVAVTLPDSGQRVVLANAPVLSEPAPEPLPAADGSWWVTGRDPANGRWVVAASRDNGKTWSATSVPVPADVVTSRLTVTVSGATVYVLATGSLPYGAEPRGLVAIFQSVDGGQSWTQTWQPSGKPPRTLGGSAVVTPDGGLFVALDDVGPGYRSLDGGRSFTPVFDGPRLTSIRRTRAGYLAMATDAPGQYLASADGRSWKAIRLP